MWVWPLELTNSFSDLITTSMLSSWFYLVYLIWYYYLSVKFFHVKQKIVYKQIYITKVHTLVSPLSTSSTFDKKTFFLSLSHSLILFYTSIVFSLYHHTHTLQYTLSLSLSLSLFPFKGIFTHRWKSVCMWVCEREIEREREREWKMEKPIFVQSRNTSWVKAFQLTAKLLHLN